MACHSRTIIRIFVLLSFLMMAFVSCDRNDDVFEVKYLSVSGVVNVGDDPVPDITVTMTAYSLTDRDRADPQYFDSCRSSFDGTYRFSLRSEQNLSEMYFVFRLYDGPLSGEEQVPLFERDLFLSRTPFYNDFSKSYEVKGNDFFLNIEQ